MSSFGTAAQRSIGRLLAPWWLFLVTGIAWTLVALILLRFDYTTVSAISILFGFVAIAAGVIEIGVTMLANGWWKVLSPGSWPSPSSPQGLCRSSIRAIRSSRWPR
jgi:uncharacterized membrane protein HdeD (DUF308 family)